MVQQKTMQHIPSSGNYREFFSRSPGQSGLVYRSLSKKYISSKIPAHEENKNTPQVIKPNLLGSVNISEEEIKRVKSDSVRFDKEHTLSICIIT